jgi:hypothetical protein
MRLAQTAFSFLLMLLPTAAGAVDLDLSAEGVTGYDNNVFRAKGDETGDVVFRLTPTVKLTSQDSKMGWSLQYRPTYEILAQHTEANELTHDVWGRFEYAFNEKTKISLFEHYRRLHVLNYPSDDGVDDESNVVPDDDIRRETVDINDGSFSLSHVFSPKWSGQTNASYRLFYTDRKNANHSKNFTGSQSFQYALNAANDVGFGASITAQMWDGFEFQPASNTFFYNLFGTWVRRFGDSTTLSLRVGPALIHTDQDDIDLPLREEPLYPHTVVTESTTADDLREKYEFLQWRFNTTNNQFFELPATIPAGSVLVPSVTTCELNYNELTDRCAFQYLILPWDPQASVIRSSVVPVTLFNSGDGTSDLKVTVFGEVRLTHRWTPTLASTLLYNRSDSTASAQGSSSIADMVSLLTTWRPGELWDLSIRGTYLRRESATEISQEALGVERSSVLNPYPYPMLNGQLAYIDVDHAIDTERWSVHARAARRVTRRMTMTLRLTYTNQQTRRSDRNPDTFENYMALFGVRYDFDPIRF